MATLNSLNSVKDFWSLLRQYNDVANLRTKMSDFRGKTFVVDVSVWVHQALNSPDSKNDVAADLLHAPRLDISSYIFKFLDQKKAFYDHFEITLVLMMDGPRNFLKEAEDARRRAGTTDAIQKFQEYIDSDQEFDDRKALELARKAIYPRQDVYFAVYQWGLKANVKVRAAAIEADFQVVAENKYGCDAIITIDGDILAQGGMTVITDIDESKKSRNGKNCTVWTQEQVKNVRKKFNNGRKMSDLDFFAFCCFLGSDYVDRPHGLGPAKLQELFPVWIQMTLTEKDALLNRIENGLNADGTANTVGKVPGYTNKFKNSFCQFANGAYFKRANDGSVSLEFHNKGVDLSKYMNDVTLGYDPVETVAVPGYTYAQLYDLEIWARTKAPLSDLKIPLPKDDKGNEHSHGSIIDTTNRPFRKQFLSSLLIFMQFRGWKHRGDSTRAEVQKVITYLDSNPENFPILDDPIVGNGKYIALDTLVSDPINYVTDPRLIFEVIRSLPKVNDEWINPRFKNRPSTSKRAVTWTTNGHCDVGRIKYGLVKIKNGKDIPIDCYMITMPCTPSQTSEEYDVMLLFRKRDGAYLGAPHSRCQCLAGNLFCAHMLALILVLGIIQEYATNDLASIVAFMPMPIKNFQKLPIPHELVYSQKYSAKLFGKKLAAIYKRPGKKKGEEEGEEEEEEEEEEVEEEEDEEENIDVARQNINREFEEDVEAPLPAQCSLHAMQDVLDYCENLPKKKKEDSVSDKSRAITEEQIHKANDDLIMNRGPNATSDSRIEQLVMLLDYLAAYRNNELKKDMLFFYIDFFEDDFKHWLEILLDPDTIHFEIMGFGSRLAAIPVGWVNLTDRGFAYDAHKYPNFNPHITPHFVNKRPHFPQEELEADLSTCKLRYISETNFARVNRHSSLEDVVTYEYFGILQHILDCAVGDANFCQPFYSSENSDKKLGE